MGIIKKIFRILYKGSKRTQSAPSKLDNYISSGLIQADNSSIIRNIKLTIRKEVLSKTFLSIDEESVINGHFIFENEKGNISIGKRTFLGGGNFISINNIEIGNDVLISWGCTIMDNNAHSLKWSERKSDVSDWKRGIEEHKIGAYKDWTNVISAPIIIKNKSWIGFDVVILKGVTIGEGAIVGSRSVVTKDVPAWSIVAGNPAQLVRMIPENER